MQIQDDNITLDHLPKQLYTIFLVTEGAYENFYRDDGMQILFTNYDNAKAKRDELRETYPRTRYELVSLVAKIID